MNLQDAAVSDGVRRSGGYWQHELCVHIRPVRTDGCSSQGCDVSGNKPPRVLAVAVEFLFLHQIHLWGYRSRWRIHKVANHFYSFTWRKTRENFCMCVCVCVFLTKHFKHSWMGDKIPGAKAFFSAVTLMVIGPEAHHRQHSVIVLVPERGDCRQN